ncbi:conserved hypothetical protein [delta proteobacterium NaphS2]|nr:conserved hypothetical protein [delta proteobacterium NaphS2]
MLIRLHPPEKVLTFPKVRLNALFVKPKFAGKIDWRWAGSLRI